ncbi:hypothetical protein M2118_000482 [Aurantimicrobium minutum]|uniref:tail fiber protein n=1 Tax=Aurantimicrobium minutum TaxID=708131 RepID=UPI002476E48E|nr:tail fiber protein [Aurantimicrobium minutum]MDH6277531.1 hypothetical protein [Aurantimicrobium minutum]
MSDYPEYSSDVAWFKDTIKGLQAQVDELSRGRNVPSLAGIPTGTYLYCAGRNAPAGTLKTDGASYAVANYPDLAAYLRPKIGTVTVSVANPAVFTCAGHALVPGDRVYLTTSGALPSGLASYTVYYVIASGLTADAFRLSASSGGAAIVTSGTQSGTHSVYFSPYEAGAVSSVNFKVPDNGDYVLVGTRAGSAEFGSVGATFGAKTHTLTSDQMPTHTHRAGYADNNWKINYNPGASTQVLLNYDVFTPTTTALDTTPSGGSQAHNNIQPSRSATLVIKT